MIRTQVCVGEHVGLHVGIPFGNGRHGVRPLSARPLLSVVSGGGAFKSGCIRHSVF